MKNTINVKEKQKEIISTYTNLKKNFDICEAKIKNYRSIGLYERAEELWEVFNNVLEDVLEEWRETDLFVDDVIINSFYNDIEMLYEDWDLVK